MNGQHVDPDEIFNMFFGGGMPMGGGGFGPGMHFYSNGFGPGMHFRAGGPRARPRAAPGGQQHPDQEPARNAGMNLFLQLLPILFMMLLSFSSYGNNDASASMPGVDRYFSLTVRSCHVSVSLLITPGYAFCAPTFNSFWVTHAFTLYLVRSLSFFPCPHSKTHRSIMPCIPNYPKSRIFRTMFRTDLCGPMHATAIN